MEEYFDSSDNMILFEKFNPEIIQEIEDMSHEDLEEDEFSMFSEESDNVKRVKITPTANAMNDINIWVVHLRKNITKKLVEQIVKIEGVEMLHPYTRYRFILGIGKLFNENKVKTELSTYITEYIGTLKE